MSLSDFIFIYFWTVGALFAVYLCILEIKTDEEFILIFLNLVVGFSAFGISLIAFIEHYKDQYREVNEIKEDESYYYL